MVAGWTHGGKTSALLAFAEHGARFVGDDLVLLSGDGCTMFGLPASLRLSDAQLRQLPHVRGNVPTSQRLMASALRTLTARDGSVARGPFRLVQSAARKAEARFKTPARLEAVFPSGCALVAKPRRLFFMMSHSENDIAIQPANARDIAERMSHSLRFEASPLLSQYLAFRFAFPGIRNKAIETMHEVEHGLLQRALARQMAYVVLHPYPAPLRGLYEAMRPFCVTTPPVSAARREMVLL